MMKITEVRICLVNACEGKDRLRAFVNITLDDSLIIRDIRVINGNNGFFITMPDRKLTEHCQNCNAKNSIESNFCNKCGTRLEQRNLVDENGRRKKFYADIIHPITPGFRRYLTQQILLAYNQNVQRRVESGVTRFCNNMVTSFTQVSADSLTAFGQGL